MPKIFFVPFFIACISPFSNQKPMDRERSRSPIAENVNWSDLEDLFPLEDATFTRLQTQTESPTHLLPVIKEKEAKSERNKRKRERYAEMKARDPTVHKAFIQKKYENSKLKLAKMTEEERGIEKANRNARSKFLRQNRKLNTGFMTKQNQEVAHIRKLIKNKEATKEQIQKLENLNNRRRELKQLKKSKSSNVTKQT